MSIPNDNRNADYLPTASLKNLERRSALLQRLRSFFCWHEFLEVETPILSADTVVDRHLDPFCVVTDPTFTQPSPPAPLPKGEGRREQGFLPKGEGSSKKFWLQTSPEFGMKRLLAAGAKAIYQVSKVFRRDELGPLHNPEFTMVEWYRTGDGMNDGMQLLSDLCEALLDRGSAERICYREAFSKHVGIDPLAAETKTIVETGRRLNIAYPESLPEADRDGWLDLLLIEKVQPHLGKQRPAILYDFPASQAALSVVRQENPPVADSVGWAAPTMHCSKVTHQENPPVAERFELYVEGIELANGYHELLDAEELLRRNKAANAQRIADGKQPLPEESRLHDAMRAGLPPCTGAALGFDRLAMLAAGAKTLAEVLAFPFDRA
jgi:elongation factor P--(R)-beta-lysine ligase